MKPTKQSKGLGLSALALSKELIMEERKTNHKQFTFTDKEEVTQEECKAPIIVNLESQSTSDTKRLDEFEFEDEILLKPPKRRDASTNVLNFAS